MTGPVMLEGFLTAVVDAPERHAAVAIFERLCSAIALAPVGALHWEPYGKLGPHSLVESRFTRAAADSAAAIAELDRLAEILADAPADYDPGQDRSRSVIRYGNGVVDYSRTIDARVLPITAAGVLWLELRARIG